MSFYFYESTLIEQDSFKNLLECITVSDIEKYKNDPLMPFSSISDGGESSPSDISDGGESSPSDISDGGESSPSDISDGGESSPSDKNKNKSNIEKYKNECSHVKEMWTKFNSKKMTEEEKLYKKIILDKCSGMQAKELYKKYKDKVNFRSKNVTSFSQCIFKTRVQTMQYKYGKDKLPDVPKQWCRKEKVSGEA